MTEHDGLAAQFEAQRSHLEAVAYRMLGSRSEADDAVQETWLRLSRADVGDVENLGGWLTTVIARICLDLLRARGARREDPVGAALPEPVASSADGSNPEYEALLADSLGPALIAVLDTLAPAERVALVLHDVFGVPFDEIGPILGRSPNAAKQLASRARARLRAPAPVPDPDLPRQREVVDAFLAASRSGDLAALVALLDPDVVLRADPAAVEMGAPDEVRGAAAVAGVFSGRAQEARPALLDGTFGVAWAPGGQVRVAWDLTIVNGTIRRIDMLADPSVIAELDLVLV